MGYFENVGLTNINDLFTEISTRLVAAGATRTVLNSLSTEPAADRVGREELFKFNGTASKPTAGYVTITRFYDSNTFNKGLAFTCFTGIKGPIDVATTVQSGVPTVTVTTSTNHGFATGDLVFINGSSTATLNEGSSGLYNSLSTITVTDATTFTYTANLSQTASGTGGKCFAVYNSGAHRTVKSSTYRAWLGPSDSAMKVFGYVDEFHMVGVVVQGATFLPFFIGQTGRAQIPPNYADTAFTTGSVTGNGATPSTFDLDRSCSNLRVGQKIALISPNSASAEIVTIATKPTATQFTAIVTNGTTYPAGTLIGEDPLPLMVMGGGSTQQDLGSKVFYAALRGDCTRTGIGGQTYFAAVEAQTVDESYCDPNVPSGRYSGKYVNLYTTSSGKEDDKGRLVGMVAWSLGSQADFDRIKTGESDPGDFYKIFPTQKCDTSWGFSLGPGANA